MGKRFKEFRWAISAKLAAFSSKEIELLHTKGTYTSNIA